MKKRIQSERHDEDMEKKKKKSVKKLRQKNVLKTNFCADYEKRIMQPLYFYFLSVPFEPTTKAE
jgi:hypothetical protein